MNPIQLTLKGFKGIKAGLGREQVTITIPEDGDLIAVIGPNGAGKSTILDNLHPYRVMPSRSSSYSPGSFSFYDQTEGNAEKSIRFEHEGEHYVSSVVIKGLKKTKTQECYLNRVTGADGIWENLEPVSLPDGTTSDGKAATYDALVEHLLGSPEMFFTAAFSCQGRKTLADYSNGDIKALLADLLGLDTIRDLSVNANEVARGAKLRLDNVQGRLTRATEINTEREATQVGLTNATNRLDQLKSDRASQTEQHQLASQRLAEAQSQHADSAETERRRVTLTGQLKAVDDRMSSTIQQLNEDTEDTRSKAVEELSSQNSNLERLTVISSKLDTRTQENNAILDLEDAVKEAEAQIDDTEKELAAEQRRYEEAEAVKVQFRAQNERLTSLENELELINKDGATLSQQIDELTRRADLVKDVPCHGMPLQNTCQLLSDAREASATIEKLQGEQAVLKENRHALVEKIEAANQTLASLTDPDLNVIQQRIRKLENSKTTYVKLTARRSELDTAHTEKTRLEEEKISCIQAIDETKSKIEAVNKHKADLETKYYERLAEIKASFDAERGALQTELAALPPTDDAELQAALGVVDAMKSATTKLDEELATAQSNQGLFQGRLEALEKEQASLADDVERAERLGDEVAQWTLLSKALGNDGIIALSIDDAGPTLTRICNDLLTVCYGPRFSVSLVTQEETKAGTLKEVFDVIVYDAERGDAKSFKDVSGGERVWINECMTRAIGLFQLEASGRNYGCLFSDESDGALDMEKKRQFAAMKRRVIELGDYHREIFISHSAEVQECADAVIDVAALAA